MVVEVIATMSQLTTQTQQHEEEEDVAITIGKGLGGAMTVSSD